MVQKQLQKSWSKTGRGLWKKVRFHKFWAKSKVKEQSKIQQQARKHSRNWQVRQDARCMITGGENRGTGSLNSEGRQLDAGVAH